MHLRGDVVLLLLCLASILLCDRAEAWNGNRFVLQAQLQGGAGDPTYGDLFGTPLALNGRELFVGALYADGIPPSSGGPAPPRAGRTYFYERHNNGWSESQPEYVGASAYNQNSGTNIDSEDEWLFNPEAGTPLNVSDPDLKDRAGNIDIFRKVHGKWVMHQRIPNPDGHGPEQNHAEFGIHLSYTRDGGGWLLAGGGITNKAWFIRFDRATQRWIPVQSVETGPNRGNLIVAIDGIWAFIQVPLDFTTFDNLRVLVYKRNRRGIWEHHQDLAGYDNTGPLKGFAGDLFGSPMSIDGRNAVIGAPGDAQADPTPFSVPGATYFARLQRDRWVLVSKVFSDRPNLLFGLGNCLKGDTAIVADTARTVGSNQGQGALRVYERQGNKWIPKALLTDPHGRAFDYFSVCAISGSNVAGASFRAAPDFLQNPALIGPPHPGRVVVWRREERD